MNLAGKNTVETSDYSYLNADELRAAWLQKEADLEAKEAIIAHTHDLLTQAIADRDKYKTITTELLRLAKVLRFAASSEKSAYQIDLFDEAELDAAIDDLREQVPDTNSTDKQNQSTSAPKSRQRGFAASLKRIRRELCLSEQEKAGASKTFFTKIKEELEYIPAQLNVIEIWQEKAVFEQGSEEQLVAAKRPIHPLGKCIASTALLAYITVSYTHLTLPPILLV